MRAVSIHKLSLFKKLSGERYFGINQEPARFLFSNCGLYFLMRNG